MRVRKATWKAMSFWLTAEASKDFCSSCGSAPPLTGSLERLPCRLGSCLQIQRMLRSRASSRMALLISLQVWLAFVPRDSMGMSQPRFGVWNFTRDAGSVANLQGTQEGVQHHHNWPLQQHPLQSSQQPRSSIIARNVERDHYICIHQLDSIFCSSRPAHAGGRW